MRSRTFFTSGGYSDASSVSHVSAMARWGQKETGQRNAERFRRFHRRHLDLAPEN
jgi:hypothetical protein